jgi:hypothetical protein
MIKRDKAALVQTGLRIRGPLLARLDKAASTRGISLNAEIIDRLDKSFVWERAFREAQALIDNANRITTGTLRQFMIDAGYTPVSTPNGRAWYEPGSKVSEAVRGALRSGTGEGP